jgi:hypothetical protein
MVGGYIPRLFDIHHPGTQEQKKKKKKKKKEEEEFCHQNF